MYDTAIVFNQNLWFGPFPISYKEIADEETQKFIIGLMHSVPSMKDIKPFRYLKEREICDADKAFVLKIMKLDPRDRLTAKELLKDESFTERSGRTVGWYSKDEWKEMQEQKESN